MDVFVDIQDNSDYVFHLGPLFTPHILSGYCFHPWCPDGRAGVRAGSRVGAGKKFVTSVSQKL